ncbi:hypothetical protein B0H67DRAFT_660303, partial [Lasiosphaeris hirsuta]
IINLDRVGSKLTAGCKKNEELSAFTHTAIIGTVTAGVSQSAVARVFRVDRKVVQRAIQRFESLNTVESRPRTGRPEILARREQRHIIQLAKRNPHLLIYLFTNIVDTRVSRSTLHRVLRNHHM